MTLCFLRDFRVLDRVHVHGNWSAACYAVGLKDYFDPFHPVPLRLMDRNRLFLVFVSMVPQMPEVLLALTVMLHSVLAMIAPVIFRHLTMNPLPRLDLVI